MTKDFQNQQPLTPPAPPHDAPRPQHGQRPDTACLALKEKRSFEPRPAH